MDPDPHAHYGSGSRIAKWMRIHADPDPQHWFCFICNLKLLPYPVCIILTRGHQEGYIIVTLFCYLRYPTAELFSNAELSHFEGARSGILRLPWPGSDITLFQSMELTCWNPDTLSIKFGPSQVQVAQRKAVLEDRQRQLLVQSAQTGMPSSQKISLMKIRLAELLISQLTIPLLWILPYLLVAKMRRPRQTRTGAKLVKKQKPPSLPACCTAVSLVAPSLWEMRRISWPTGTRIILT